MLIAKSLIDDASSGIVDTYSAETAIVNGKVYQRTTIKKKEALKPKTKNAEQMVAVKVNGLFSNEAYERCRDVKFLLRIFSVDCVSTEESVGTKVSSLTSIGRNHYPDNEKYILSVGCETQQMIAMKVNGSFTNVVKMTL
ncbi:hypothetical protein AAHA92_16792 [Salvia divinorum]|uniref:Uncharacterized protein n=1 Tax=Salvia divinorum TaxID=28513 RepID=A0ABD1GWP6_SALDI